MNVCAFFVQTIPASLNAGLSDDNLFCFYSNVGGKTMQTVHITYLYYIHIGVLGNTGAVIDLSPLYEKAPLLWLWSNAREKTGKMGEGGEVFVESELAFPDKCGALPEPPQWQ